MGTGTPPPQSRRQSSRLWGGQAFIRGGGGQSLELSTKVAAFKGVKLFNWEGQACRLGDQAFPFPQLLGAGPAHSLCRMKNFFRGYYLRANENGSPQSSPIKPSLSLPKVFTFYSTDTDMENSQFCNLKSKVLYNS